MEKHETYRDKCARQIEECDECDDLHGNGLGLSLTGNLVHVYSHVLHVSRGEARLMRKDAVEFGILVV